MAFQTTLPKIKTASVKEVDFSHLPEMAPYLEEPAAMYVGAPGKQGFLKMGFEIDPRGKCIMRELDRRAPLIVQQELYFDSELPQMPCVYILASGGPYVDGDRFEQVVEMKPGSFAFISTGASTKYAEMRSNYAGMRQRFTLEEGAYLEFLPEPNYPSLHSRFVCDTDIVIDATATLTYSEIYMCGRKHYREKVKQGEIYVYDIISVCTHAERPDGRKLFREKFIIDPAKAFPKAVGVMDGYDVFANVVVLTPADKAREIYAGTEPFIDAKRQVAAGISTLPNEAGLIYKVIGMEAGPVREQVREFASTVRKAVKGRPIPPEFPWRK